jgi:Ca2+-binding EF-hand superfamily protein
LIGLLLSLALMLGAAEPAPISPYVAESFADYGPGTDGRVALKAWQQHDWTRALADYDADHDGKISKSEMTAGLCRRAPPASDCPYGAGLLFLSLDRNHNGFLDRSEMDAWSAELFRRNDLDHDGYVTEDEMQRLAGRR